MTLRQIMSILPVLGFLWGCQDDTTSIAGTNDETHTESLARVYMPDGATPAFGALVQMTPRDAVASAGAGTVDAQGIPVLPTVPDGVYTITVSKGSLALLVDSLVVVGGKLLWAGSDTLEPSATLGGIVKVEPQDDPARVTVNVLGTEIWANVGHDGQFKLVGLGAGRLRLRFATTDTAYTTTYDTGRTVPGGASSLRDTVRMIYTGIPVVQGLVVENDSATGDLLLRWPKVRYGQLLDYAIFRDSAGSMQYSALPRAAITDTAWRDTTAAGRLEVRRYRYRVQVRSRGGQGAVGSWVEAVTGTSVPPWLLHLDSLRWTESVRTSAGNLGELAGRMAVAQVRTGTDSVRVGLRTSTDGLAWDTATLSLPRLRSGQEIQWRAGFGAGRLWAFGHSLLGDGVYCMQSLDGSRWDSARVLEDSLWPVPATSVESVQVSGDAQHVVLSGGSPLRLVWSRDGQEWTRRNLSGRLLGLDTAGFLSDGGGLHLLSHAWAGGVPTDLGLWDDQAAMTQAVVWNGRPAVLASGCPWVHEAAGWSLRQGTDLVRLQVVAGRLLVQDSRGRIWEGR